MRFTNAFSKNVELVAIPDWTPETVAKAVFDKWICQYGGPTQIITNQEKEFCNELTAELFKIIKLTPETTSKLPMFYFQEQTAN